MQSTNTSASQNNASHVHLSQRAYVVLRSMAMTYRFPPDQRLNEVELARDLKVSRTPLREAMHRLVSEGLLTSVSGRGFRARSLNVKEVFDLYEARLALETQIAQLACERATPDMLDALDAYLAESVQEQESAAVERLVQLDEGFHERVAELTGNAELLRMLRNINARIHFFRWVDMQGRRDSTQGEHRALAAAIRARDTNAANEVVRHHITRRLDQIIDVIREGYARLYMGEGPKIAELAAGAACQEQR
jgi:DNA-binding GntR family transcriptional regulator